MGWPANVRRSFPLVLGGVAITAAAAPMLVATSTARTVRAIGSSQAGGFSSSRAVTGAVVIGGAVGGVVAGARIARRRVVRRIRDSARDIDPGLRLPPESPLVSSGPGSHVSVQEIGREGARYVATATTGQDVETVMGEQAIAEPIRVFVGWDAASTIQGRVDLAMAELRRTGAFDRSCLVVQSPAGTGYANATPIDVVELLTLGDCASVAVGYGLLPSFLSLKRVEIALQTQHALLHAIARECRNLIDPPRLLLYGESLGAKVQQLALHSGVADLDGLGIDAALWVGTPGGRDYDHVHDAFSSVSVTIDHPGEIAEVLRDRPDARVWFLEHHGDPVVRFRSDLMWRRPDWLSPPQGRGVPSDMQWQPVITWAQVLVDTVYATDVTPGDFQSSGHDYRADLGRVVTAAYRLASADAAPDWLGRLERHLRQLEVRRAESFRGILGASAS